MKIFTDKYSKILKSFNATFKFSSNKVSKTSLNCISEFENLKEFKLQFISLDITEPIDDCLSLIGQKCTKLLKLHLILNFSFLTTDRFFKIFSEFKAIKKLKIRLSEAKVLSGSVECFKHCKQLIELDIIYPELREDFFANIASFVPKLQYLYIETRKQFSDSFILNNSFHTLKYMQEVRLIVNNNQERTYHDKFWYFNKALSDRMGSNK